MHWLSCQRFASYVCATLYVPHVAQAIDEEAQRTLQRKVWAPARSRWGPHRAAALARDVSLGPGRRRDLILDVCLHVPCLSSSTFMLVQPVGPGIHIQHVTPPKCVGTLKYFWTAWIWLE